MLADADLTRARGGGNLRGIDYTVLQSPPGVGAVTSPLLITATTGNASSTNAAVTDLSQVTQAGNGAQQDLGENGTLTYAPGPAIPLYDPTVSVLAGYLRRSDQTSLETTTSTSGTDTSTDTGALDFINAGIDYQQGFSIGAQIDASVTNASQVLYGSNSQYDPVS